MDDAYISCEQILNGGVGGILVIGGRGSGKTSFEDALIRVLREKEIACTKIDLDERMVAPENEMLFIRTILTEILTASKESGLLEENIIDKTLSLLRGLKIEGELDIGLPGMKFIGSSSSDQKTQFSYIVLRDGLRDYLSLLEKKGKGEARHGAILFFDEGDMLTLNRGLLQIIRNVFQNMPKIGLVIAGSTKLLSQVSEVFSPIPRFFRKIELGPYPNNHTALDSIIKPISFAKRNLLQEDITIRVRHDTFSNIVVQTTGRMPLEINLMSHFAYDDAAIHSRKTNSYMDLFLRFDKKVLDNVIKQLVGTREYNTFINSLNDTEETCLKILSKLHTKSTLEELTVLMQLHKSGDSLSSLELSLINHAIRDSKNYYDDTLSVLESIMEKGNQNKIDVLTSTLIGKPMYEIEDHLLRSYYKYGWTEQYFDLRKDITSFGGIRIFGDPISTILHSIFFPQLNKYFDPSRGSFKAHVGENDGRSLQPPTNMQLIIISYVRQANASYGHYALNLRLNCESILVEKEIKEVLYSINEIELIDAPTTMIKKSKR